MSYRVVYIARVRVLVSTTSTTRQSTFLPLASPNGMDRVGRPRLFKPTSTIVHRQQPLPPIDFKASDRLFSESMTRTTSHQLVEDRAPFASEIHHTQLFLRLPRFPLSPSIVPARGKQEEGFQGRLRLSDLHVPAAHWLSRTAVLRYRGGATGRQAPVGVLDQERRRPVVVNRRLGQGRERMPSTSGRPEGVCVLIGQTRSFVGGCASSECFLVILFIYILGVLVVGLSIL